MGGGGAPTGGTGGVPTDGGGATGGSGGCTSDNDRTGTPATPHCYTTNNARRWSAWTTPIAPKQPKCEDNKFLRLTRPGAPRAHR
ncbi:MAG: hypothetical protein U0263_28970 [Polyangiaceae bacterium]